ncbi:MAG: hypothetical protein HC854_14965 [Flavobacterium sp.]|nr:hypothetical protein [Flavobacterium sp.]
MTRNLFTFSLILSLLLFPNLSKAQFGIEINYGLNGLVQPSITNLSHVGGGILYDFNDSFGAKLDLGLDQFRKTNELTNKETGVNITRVSLQATANISYLINDNNYYNKFNLSGHFGGGYTSLKSTIYPKNDNIVNAIMGLTPKIKISPGLYFAVDTSIIFNISQHYNFEGEFTYIDAPNSITGIMYNVTGGLIYKFNDYK